jgi:hypothetical protein
MVNMKLKFLPSAPKLPCFRLVPESVAVAKRLSYALIRLRSECGLDKVHREESQPISADTRDGAE